MSTPIATSVLRARVSTDSTGVEIQVPVLITPHGIVEPLLDYVISRWHDRSLAWMKKVTRAVRLFVEYVSANPNERDNYRVFLNFAQRLHTGTVALNEEQESSGLGWKPLSHVEARNIVSRLNDFFDYLSNLRPNAAQFNPRYSGSSYDRMIDDLAYQYRRDKAVLGHAWLTSSADKGGRLVRMRTSGSIELAEPPAFPEEHFERLIADGFRIGKKYDYRGILITILLHCAGFRESEPFHLFVSDVVPDPANPKSALILIRHPSEGASPPDPRWIDSKGRQKEGNRREYLQERWGMVPRTDLLGYLHAGWKGGIHERELEGGLYLRAFWFAPYWGEVFLAVWYRYLEQLVSIKRNHPFAFVNIDRGQIGSMYAISKYNTAHAAAVKRIGLNVSKAAGTTPHGHRHAYGQRLTRAEISREFKRRFMHHSSLQSQDPYTAPSLSVSMHELEKAAERIDAGLHSHAINAVIGRGFHG